jgi:hypothetical protein
MKAAVATMAAPRARNLVGVFVAGELFNLLAQYLPNYCIFSKK